MKMKLQLCFALFLAMAFSPAYSQQDFSKATELVGTYLSTESPLAAKANTLQYEVDMDATRPGDLRQIHALQQKDGIYIREGILTLTYDRTGKLYPMDEFVEPTVNTTVASIGAEEALRRSLNFHGFPNANVVELQWKDQKKAADQHMIYDRSMIAASDLQSRLMYIQFKDEDQLRLTWETQLHTNDRQHYWVSYVDAQTGQILEVEDKVLHCSFGGAEFDNLTEESQAHERHHHHQVHMGSAKMWDELEQAREVVKSMSPAYGEAPAAAFATAHTYLVLDMPNEAPNDNTNANWNGSEAVQESVTTAGDPLASPYGWLSLDGQTDAPNSKGNNVYAFYDPSPGLLGGAPNTGAVNSGGDALSGYEFNYMWDLSREPEYIEGNTAATNTFPNRNAAIVNLFYWNNLMHDVFYHFGFTEEGLNFQNTNTFNGTNRGGLANDEVLAQAQDGGGVNNANMLTLADGINGQMQMYLWTASSLAKLVEITEVDGGTGTLQAGELFESVEGALYNDANSGMAKLSSNPQIGKEFVIAQMGCGDSQNCNGAAMASCNDMSGGKIALIDRGSCSFVQKVYNAQLAGADAAIVMNNNQANPDEVIAMGGTDPEVNLITIPSAMISFNSGQRLKEILNSGGTIMGDLRPDPTAPLGVKRDGDFDNGVIAHEYGHGISIRTSPQTATGGSLAGSDEQGGEGWADYYALYMTTTASDLSAPTAEHPNGMLPPRGIGSYVRYQDYATGAGIRPRRYSPDMSINEYTFTGSTNGGFGVTASEITIPHGIGFIWCTMEYDLTQKMIDLYGMQDDKYKAPDVTSCANPNSIDDLKPCLAADQGGAGGFSVALMLINTGISMQASQPKFTDMRQGILDADQALYGGVHECAIWEVFARRGLGFGADSGTDAIGDETESYAVPATCDPTQVYYDITKTAASSVNNDNELVYTIQVKNTSPTNTSGTNVVVTDNLPAGANFVSATGAPFTNSSNVVTWTIPTIAADEVVTLTVTTNVATPSGATIEQTFTFEDGTESWTASTQGLNQWTRETDGAGNDNSNGYFFCPNAGSGEPISTLTSPVLPALPNRQLRFWHNYNLESGFDGGYVEATSDGGITWTLLPLQETPYNGAIDGLFNPIASPAFTGLSIGYVESAGLLPDNVTQVRFVVAEDAFPTSGEVGWSVDDVRIITNPVVIVNEASVSDPIADGGRTKSAEASTLVIGQSNNALAVELLDLTATAQENAIELNWETVSETDNAGFYVERQAKGETDFTEIGFVAGQNQAAKYNFLDVTALTNVTYTYRLRQVDYAAKANYSNLVSAMIERAGITVNINPNPATTYTEVRLEDVTGGQLNLMGTDGRLIRTYEVENTAFQQVRIDLNDLAKGVYLIQYQNGAEQIVDRIIVK